MESFRRAGAVPVRESIADMVSGEKLSACIHCGLCLTACPTYDILAEEADSPRGRLWYMRALREGRVSLTPGLRVHLDRCLACYACEVACPSGVRYRDILEGTRGWAGTDAAPEAPKFWRWFFLNVMTSRTRMRLAVAPIWLAGKAGLRGLMENIGRRLPLEWLVRSIDLLPEVIPGPFGGRHPRRLAPRGGRRLKVGLQTGCVMDAMFPGVNRLFAELLARLGAEVVVPREQGCCGSLALHQGERETGLRQAAGLVAVFRETGVDVIASTAAGCGSMMKEYGHLLPDGSGAEFASKVRDVSEVLLDLARDIPATRRLPVRVGYHEACHLRNAQKMSGPPRELLRAIPGIELVEIPGQEFCCGSAGVYNLLQPALSDELKRRKVAAVMEARVGLVVTANPGCLLQMGSGLKGVEGAPPVVHLAEVLAYAWGLPVNLPI